MRSVRTLAVDVGITVLVVVVPAAGAAVGDIYVDDSHTGPFEGTPTNPFKTIHQAIISPAVFGDVIHVASGTYNAALGEVFPIDVPSGVTIEGPDTGSLPIIGGDLIDQQVSATSLVEIVVDSSTGDVSGIELRRLRFLGENETGVDSPIALRVIVTAGKTLESFVFEYNECTRPAQNEDDEDGWATIQINAQDGNIGGRISINTVEVSHRGGMEVIAKATNSYQGVALGELRLDGNYVTNVNGSTALFGIAYHAVDGGSATFSMTGPSSISGNTVRGRGDGIWNGIEVLCDERTGYGHLHNMDDNVIDGCGNDGIVLGADGWGEPSTPEIAVSSFLRNRITGNDGSGVVLLFDRDLEDDGNGYLLLVASESNLNADNGRYGVEARGLGAGSRFGVKFINATIVYNAQGGEGFVDTQFGSDPPGEFQGANAWYHQNCIMWENNSNGAQVVGLPDAVRDALLSAVWYSTWAGIASSQGNIDTDPKFVNVSRKDYHLDDDPASPCIDAGCSGSCGYTDLTDFDLDGEDRIQDGDCAGGAVVDMGCYELAGDCP